MARVLTTPQLPLGRRITVDDQGSNSEIDCLVDTDGSGIPSPTVSHLVYCSPLFGSDTEGNGSQAAPFATIAHAYSTITDAAADNIYDVVLFPGTYSENLALKPFVRVVGYDPSEIADGTYPANIDGTVTLGAGWSTSGAVAWLTAVDVSSAVTLDFVTATSTNGIVSITNSQLEDDVTVSMAAGNTFDLHGCTLWGHCTQTGGIGFWFNVAGADVKTLTVNAIAATGATLNMANSHWLGDLHANQNGVTDGLVTINMYNSHAREGTCTVTAAGAFCPNVNAPYGALPENVVLAGSGAAALSRQMRVSKAFTISDTTLPAGGLTDITIPLTDDILGATSIEQLHCTFTPHGPLWNAAANNQIMWSFYTRKNSTVNEIHLALYNHDVEIQSGALPFLFAAYFPSTTT